MRLSFDRLRIGWSPFCRVFEALIGPENERYKVGSKKRQFSLQFKREAVRAVLAGKKSRAQIALELGIRADLLCKWQKQFAPGSIESDGDMSTMTDSERIRQLERENAILKEERDILKKAAAFFAKEQL